LGLSSKIAAATITPSFAFLEGARSKSETGETLLAITSTLGILGGLTGGSQIVKNVNVRNKLKAEIDLELKKLSPARRAAFKEYLKQSNVLQRFQPKAKNIKLNNIESIKDPKAHKAIREFLKTNRKKVNLREF